MNFKEFMLRPISKHVYFYFCDSKVEGQFFLEIIGKGQMKIILSRAGDLDRRKAFSI